MGRRWPDSSRERVLTDIPVRPASCSRVEPPCFRRARSRGPTAVRTLWSSSTVLILPS